MATRFTIFFLLFSYALMITSMISVTAEDIDFVRPLDRKLAGMKKKKLSTFTLYWHDIVGGPNATSVPVIPAIPKFNTTTSFGLVRIIDNALTLGPELNSTPVGRAQGFYVAASQSELDLQMVQNFAFLEGKYNGSTITILGRNAISLKFRELSVVSGTGLFRFASGYADITTISFDPISGDSVIQYNVTVSHY